ncbi:hypothetical protein FHR83_006262 [Actinoplanes campanulatus]|uniref:Lipoprotein n=1 Tax=Actinoplanes campanulatus TaxID=113559 RepID=A0A7W5ALP5_9ACTN|nr:hypothetical protein [Actinoplanes campanulatus]MBB3098563.1 hypothetical protein [Actinoplanes campanulatus]GGN35916.1 hypothetical protein GCM10010109_60340 [Actinoplanes campanulatus]GID39257.1 hypothetical protein Aca09nite_57630 [Actinoplanes campanulatus]
MRRIVSGLCLLAVALAGCARPGTGPQDTPSSTPAQWSTHAADVTGVAPGPGSRAVTVRVAALTGPDGCSRNVRVARTEEENGTVFVSVTEESMLSSVHGVCPGSTPVSVTVTSATAFGSRVVTVNQQPWVLRGGVYQRCDPELGCNPPGDHCDATWTRAAVRGLDVSRHSQGSVESCDADWLVMTVPDDPAACGAEVRPGCEVNTAVRRYFLRAGATGWSLVARTGTAGCAAIRKADASFPTARCADLPAPGRFVTSAPPLPSDAPPGG